MHDEDGWPTPRSFTVRRTGVPFIDPYRIDFEAVPAPKPSALSHCRSEVSYSEAGLVVLTLSSLCLSCRHRQRGQLGISEGAGDSERIQVLVATQTRGSGSAASDHLPKPFIFHTLPSSAWANSSFAFR